MTYLLRVSLDIEGSQGFKNSPRFQVTVKTVKSLSRKNNKVVILSHRGRPKRQNHKLSLKPFQPLLSKALGKNVIFLAKLDFRIIKDKISKAPNGSIFLLENLRFLPGEIKNNTVLAKRLANLGDIYVNDDFATSHRENASNVGVSKFLPSRLGPNFKKELVNLDKIKNPKKPLVVIIGGTKMTDKIGVIRYLLPKAQYILLGGGPANTLLKVLGNDIGKSVYDPKLIGVAKKLAQNKKIILPLDWKISSGRILDIGPTTIPYYREFLKGARTIVWNGPLGLFEKPKFAEGSYAVAKLLAKSKAFTVVGGGETGEIIAKLKLEKKIGFVSTGGGAMLDYLAGEKLLALKYIRR